MGGGNIACVHYLDWWVGSGLDGDDEEVVGVVS